MITAELLFRSRSEIMKADLNNLKKLENKDINRIFEKMMNPDQDQRISSKECLREFLNLVENSNIKSQNELHSTYSEMNQESFTQKRIKKY